MPNTRWTRRTSTRGVWNAKCAGSCRPQDTSPTKIFPSVRSITRYVALTHISPTNAPPWWFTYKYNGMEKEMMIMMQRKKNLLRRWVCLEQDEKSEPTVASSAVQQLPKAVSERRRWGAGCICTKVNLCKSESLEHGPGMVSPACSRCHKSRVSVSQSLHLPLKYFLLF